jgi:hypothetical protein
MHTHVCIPLRKLSASTVRVLVIYTTLLSLACTLAHMMLGALLIKRATFEENIL